MAERFVSIHHNGILTLYSIKDYRNMGYLSRFDWDLPCHVLCLDFIYRIYFGIDTRTIEE